MLQKYCFIPRASQIDNLDETAAFFCLAINALQKLLSW